MRTEISVPEQDPQDVYRLLTATVVPRPIAWVSTRSADGVDNLAPHSFFTVACVRPPLVQFTSVGEKDSLRNIRATEEFVVNLSPEWLTLQVNRTATDFPSYVSEFDEVGVAREPSATVSPPRVADSPVALECRLEQLVEPGDCTIVLGRVQRIALEESTVEQVHDRPHPVFDRLRPMARLGRSEWSGPGPVRRLRRVPYQEWQQGARD